MRISDWSSDVCSSDLGAPNGIIMQRLALVSCGLTRTGRRAGGAIASMASRHARCRRTHPREDPRHRRSGPRPRARGAVAVLARVEPEPDLDRAASAPRDVATPEAPARTTACQGMDVP